MLYQLVYALVLVNRDAISVATSYISQDFEALKWGLKLSDLTERTHVLLVCSSATADL